MVVVHTKEGRVMSAYEEFKWMIKYLDELDVVNAKIVEGLGRYGPRNISLVAKAIHLPITTVGFRLRKLITNGFLQLNALLDYSKLNLTRAVLIAENFRGNEELLWKAIDNVGYWTYISRCYGKYNGLYALFGFPIRYKEELQSYFAEAANLNVVSQNLLFWTTNPLEVNLNFKWFNFDKKEWVFSWREWLENVLGASSVLPECLRDVDVKPAAFDEIDLLMLKELSKDATVEFTELAKIVHITPQGVRYRFNNHIVQQGLIRGYDIAIFPFPPQICDMCSFVIRFKDEKALGKFANALQDKPFVLNYAKILRQNALVVHFYVPKKEFPNLMQFLNGLAEKDIVESFFYVSLDLASFKRQTISYEHFKDGEWTYDFGQRLENLRKLAKK